MLSRWAIPLAASAAIHAVALAAVLAWSPTPEMPVAHPRRGPAMEAMLDVELPIAPLPTPPEPVLYEATADVLAAIGIAPAVAPPPAAALILAPEPIAPSPITHDPPPAAPPAAPPTPTNPAAEPDPPLNPAAVEPTPPLPRIPRVPPDRAAAARAAVSALASGWETAAAALQRAAATLARRPAHTGVKDPPAAVRGPTPLAANAPPEYPRRCRELRQQGTATVRLTVSAEGSVLSVALARSSGFDALDAAAMDAVKAWRFSPALDGSSPPRPVRCDVQLPVVFVLRD